MIRILELLELLNFPELPGLLHPKKHIDPTNTPDLMDIKDLMDLKNLTNMDPTGLTDPTEYFTLLFFCFICPQHTVITEECGGQQPLPRQGRGQCPD